MEGISLIRVEENDDSIKKILFNRPISSLHTRRIGILAGRHASLKKINDLFEIVSLFGHEPILVAELELKEANIPAHVFLEPGKNSTQGYTNTDQALELFADCSYVIVGMDIEIGSHLQIFLEHLVSSRQAPVIFTSPSIGLFKVNPKLINGRTNDIYALDTKNLIDLANALHQPTKFKPNAGIFNKLGLMRDLSNLLNSDVLCLENYQILNINNHNLEKAPVISIPNPNDTEVAYLFIAILTSLLCDVSNPENDIDERVITAGYLLRAGLIDRKNFAMLIKKAINN